MSIAEQYDVIKAGVLELIRTVGDDPKRQGLVETPRRFVKAWEEWCGGYSEDPATYLTQFDLDESYDAFVVLRGISFYSHCEHHLAPFFGRMTIGYLPVGNRIVGLSKIVRVVRAYAHRLQVQERLVAQIADCLREHLRPAGVGVIAEARHFCMTSRGVNEPHATMITAALRGDVLTSQALKDELFAHHHNGQR